jgi:hypothetical protein
MTFDNCSQAYAAGYANIPQGDPHYAAALDRDHDGVACDNPPANFRPAQHTRTGTATQGRAGTPAPLPTTGPAGEAGAIGTILLGLGVVAAVAVRRRRTRFVA